MKQQTKILIVDDEIDYIKTIINCFSNTAGSYIFFQALNGRMALNIVAKEMPDLIITDWEMPEMDGIEFTAKLKSDELTKDIPVIMCTGKMTSSGNLETALAAGAVDFIRKPIDKIELIARIKSVLEIAQSRKIIKQEISVIEQKNLFINAVLKNIPHPFVNYSVDGTIIISNDKFSELCNREIANCANQSVYQIFDSENVALHKNEDIRLIAEKRSVHYHIKYLEKDYLVSKSYIENKIAENPGIMCLFTDITELNKIHNEILESKKRELITTTLRVVHLNQLIDDLKTDLNQIYSIDDLYVNEIVNRIKSKLSISTTENFWKEFQLRFENVHESFYGILNQKFPDLTPGEKKLCALLKLNLSSKDIAVITSQNPQSVDMARYRLRKKLNLKQDENLIEFLENIKI